MKIILLFIGEHVMVNGSFVLKNGKTVSDIFPEQAVYGKFKK
ncbi:hypothetical protein [Emticicia sp.]